MLNNLPKPKERTSMLYWYPEVKDVLPTPKTKFIKLEKCENSPYGVIWDEEEVHEAIQELGGYPAFIRTDLASDKFWMKEGSRVENEDELMRHIARVIEFNQLASVIGLPFVCLAVREWLNLDHKFKAFYGTPIAKEIRVFIRDGEVECYHFYWPEEAIKFFRDTEEPDNWQELLKETREETIARELTEALDLAWDVAKIFDGDGYWSVDFALTEEGDWYLIDMAEGEKSWHPECKYKKEGR